MHILTVPRTRRSKEYFTSSLVPATDESCDWSWRNGRCEPACDCRLKYSFGDFHLGRSCRKRSLMNRFSVFEEGGGVGSDGGDRQGGGMDGSKGGEGMDGGGKVVGEEGANGANDGYDSDNDAIKNEMIGRDAPPPNCENPPDSLYYRALTRAIKHYGIGKERACKRLQQMQPKSKFCDALSGRAIGKKGLSLPVFPFCNKDDAEKEDEDDDDDDDGEEISDEEINQIKKTLEERERDNGRNARAGEEIEAGKEQEQYKEEEAQEMAAGANERGDEPVSSEPSSLRAHANKNNDQNIGQGDSNSGEAKV